MEEVAGGAAGLKELVVAGAGVGEGLGLEGKECGDGPVLRQDEQPQWAERVLPLRAT